MTIVDPVEPVRVPPPGKVRPARRVERRRPEEHEEQEAPHPHGERREDGEEPPDETPHVDVLA